MKNTERTLSKDREWYQVYSDQIKDMVERGSCKKLTEVELEKWKGPIFYICHLAVQNPKSATTPVRIVFNSSHTCKGISLNSCLAKGPTAYMNSLIEILLRFREYGNAMLSDISKMFHAISIPEVDQHCHRFLWRNMEDRPPDEYVITKVSFGDICSPTIAMETLYETGNRVKDTQPEVSYILKNSTYVDDIAHSTQNDTSEVSKATEEVLKAHGFQLKDWIFSGEETPEPIQVLGITWNPKLDEIRFITELNFSPKKKGIRTGPNLKRGELKEKLPSILTKRTCLEQVAKTYDPLGLIGPHTLRAKILLRQTWEMKLTWDEPLSESLHQKWADFFTKTFELEDISFRRCVMPPGAKEDPMLVIFSDGSQTAYGCAAYIRWKLDEDKYLSSLILGKNRIAPMNQVSIPRLELCGALIATRVRKLLEKACRYKFSKIVHLIDSEIVLNQISSLCTRFKVYEGMEKFENDECRTVIAYSKRRLNEG